MNDDGGGVGEKSSFDKRMFHQVSDPSLSEVFVLYHVHYSIQMPPTHSQFHASSSTTTNDQDELIARRKLEQKRRFQQKQGKASGDVDTLMQSMFTDLKLQPKATTPVPHGRCISTESLCNSHRSRLHSEPQRSVTPIAGENRCSTMCLSLTFAIRCRESFHAPSRSI